MKRKPKKNPNPYEASINMMRGSTGSTRTATEAIMSARHDDQVTFFGAERQRQQRESDRQFALQVLGSSINGPGRLSANKFIENELKRIAKG